MWDYALYHAALWHVAEKVRCPCHARWQPWGGLLGLDWGSPPVVSLWHTTLPKSQLKNQMNCITSISRCITLLLLLSLCCVVLCCFVFVVIVTVVAVVITDMKRNN